MAGLALRKRKDVVHRERPVELVGAVGRRQRLNVEADALGGVGVLEGDDGFVEAADGWGCLGRLWVKLPKRVSQSVLGAL